MQTTTSTYQNRGNFYLSSTNSVLNACRSYELSNHLGNVLSVISDKVIPHVATGTTVDYYMADIVQSTDYSSFHAPLSGRTLYKTNNTLDYRFGGSNGQEKTDEIAGNGNHYTAEHWEYDTRLARRWNIDPVVKEHRSPYDVFSNNPIIMVDPKGDDDYYNSDGTYNTKMSKKYNDNGTHNIYVLSADGKGKTLLADMPIKTENQIAIVEKVMSGYAKKAGVSGKVKLERLAKNNSYMAETKSRTQNGKLVSSTVVVNSNGGINDKLSDYHNLVSTLFHEGLHQKDAVKGTSTESDKTFNGLMVHAEVYKRQIEDKSYDRTSADFKENNIRAYASYLQDAANLLNESFDEQGDKAKILGMIDHFNANEGKEYGFNISFQWISTDSNGKATYEVKSHNTNGK